MAIIFVCPHCQTSLQTEDDLAGKKGTCPKCKKEVNVPQKESATQSGGKETTTKE